MRLYGRVWPSLPQAIERARSWGSEWFDLTTPSFLMDGARMVAHAGQVWCDLLVAGAPARVAARPGRRGVAPTGRVEVSYERTLHAMIRVRCERATSRTTSSHRKASFMDDFLLSLNRNRGPGPVYQLIKVH